MKRRILPGVIIPSAVALSFVLVSLFMIIPSVILVIVVAPLYFHVRNLFTKQKNWFDAC
jgi:hypothetical protein